MTPQEMIDKIASSDTLGFQVAKKYFRWLELDKVEEYYKSSDIIYLANLIDNAQKNLRRVSNEQDQNRCSRY